MKNILPIFLVASSLSFIACETCSECSFVMTNADGTTTTVSDEFCSEDSDEVDAFESGFELDAASAGTTATCSR